MRYCTECGKPIDEEYSFCPYCGAIIRDENGTGSSSGTDSIQHPQTEDSGSRPVTFGKVFWASFLLGMAMGFLLGIWGLLFFPFVFVGGYGPQSKTASALTGASMGWLVGLGLDLLFALSAFGYLD